MRDGLKPYPEYKDAAMPWAGKIPKHWELRRMKFLFRERLQKGFPNEPLLAATQSRGVIRKDDYGTRTVEATKDFQLLKLVEMGDFVISLRSFEGGIEISHCRGIISPAYTVLAPIIESSSEFYSLYFKSPRFISGLSLFVTGIREGQNIEYESLSRAYMPLPPIEERESISRFLNWSTHRLDRAIKAKRKVIALLNEQKQAIIHKAVTRGLDPEVKLKDSGIPWMGEIPEHWEIRQLSRIGNIGNGSTPSRAKPSYWNNGTYPWLNSSQVNRAIIEDSDQFVTASALRECHLPRVQAGSLLVAITGQGKTRGTAAILALEATINQHIAFITPNMRVVLPEYLHLILIAAYQKLRAISEDSGSTKGALTCEDLKRFKVPLPLIDEQRALIKEVAFKTNDVVRSILRLERKIELLREYKTRLIADVVTGKLDVREAAAGLPERDITDKEVEAAIEEPDDFEVEAGEIGEEVV